MVTIKIRVDGDDGIPSIALVWYLVTKLTLVLSNLVGDPTPKHLMVLLTNW